MDSDCGYSVDDLYLSSEEESTDVGIMAGCIERQLTEPIAIPNTGTSSAQARCGTMSPPPEDRGPSCMQETPTCSYSTDTASIETVVSQFDGMALSEGAGLAGCSDCVICGKSVQQIQTETVNDYIDKTGEPGETLAETERRKRAFLDGMAAGTFLLMPGGVSQAAACDGNWYSVAYGYDRVLPGTIPSTKEDQRSGATIRLRS